MEFFGNQFILTLANLVYGAASQAHYGLSKLAMYLDTQC